MTNDKNDTVSIFKINSKNLNSSSTKHLVLFPFPTKRSIEKLVSHKKTVPAPNYIANHQELQILYDADADTDVP